MSSALYQTRIYWDGYHGIVKHGGVSVDLQAWPVAILPGVAVLSIDYTPDVKRRELMVLGDTHPREMTREQMTAAYTWLKDMAEKARNHVDN